MRLKPVLWIQHLGQHCAIAAPVAYFTGVVRTLLEGNRTGTIVAIATASLIGAPALEELVYRGFLLPSLTKWMPTPAAVSTVNPVT